VGSDPDPEGGHGHRYLKDYALKGAFLSGAEFVSWLEKKEATTKELMGKGDMLKK
jgi:hypothetical protein